MRPTQTLIALAAFAVAAGLSYCGAVWAVNLIQDRSRQEVSHKLSVEGMDWAHVSTDGLQVILTGTAPTEAARFRARGFADSVVDSARVHDMMSVTPAKDIAPPHFSVELLRNDDGISLIGLVPASTGRDSISAKIAAGGTPGQVTDLLETAQDPAPAGWDKALAYGLDALKLLPRSKISISAEKVKVTAMAETPDERRRLESALARLAPTGLDVGIEISAPRPVIAPFTLRFVIDDSGAHFDACSADSAASRARILHAAVAAGATGKIPCTIGLGVPSQSWAEAVALGIDAVHQLGHGTITFSDADISLLGVEGTPQATFDRVVGELGAKLPDVFSLDATLPKPKKKTDGGPVEFTATLSPDGHLAMRGRLTDDRTHDAIDSFARARFGSTNVFTATRSDGQLPDGWPIRVLAGLEALSELHDGNLLVQPDQLLVTGVSGHESAKDDISRILSDKLGQGKAFTIKVSYDKTYDPDAAPPSPGECLAEIKQAMAKKKITFEPGSDKIDSAVAPTLDSIAATLKKCPDVAMRIGGYTDSQGRPEMNLALSQARAQAVLNALMARRVLVGNLTAKGFGEADPIADNGTEAGREANRRIEFSLVNAAPDDSAAGDDGAAAPDAATDDAPDAGDGKAGADAAGGDKAGTDKSGADATGADATDGTPDATDGSGDATQGSGDEAGQGTDGGDVNATDPAATDSDAAPPEDLTMRPKPRPGD